ncbi:MAG: hypothetical protein U0R77_05820 [Mycolicibacterium insubricum]|nr:hypothetical protein [Mycobacterium sp.]
MDPDVLRVELDALASLAPQLRTLGDTVENPSAGNVSGSCAEIPTLVAARSIRERTLAAHRSKVSSRYSVIADRVDNARINFAEASSDRASVIAGTTTAIPTPATVLA